MRIARLARLSHMPGFLRYGHILSTLDHVRTVARYYSGMIHT